MTQASASIAFNRFGIGARPDDEVPGNPKKWLIAQFDLYEPRPALIAAAPSSATVSKDLADYFEQQRLLRQQYGRTPAQRAQAMGTAPAAGMTAQPNPQTGLQGKPGGYRPPAPRGGQTSGDTAMGAGMSAMTGAQMTPGTMMQNPALPGDGKLPSAANGSVTGGGVAPPPIAPQFDPVVQARVFAAQQSRDNYAGSIGARANQALITNTPFVERLVWFWSNHFAVSADKLEITGLAGTLEFEAIRPHVLGTFGDMLNAVERHPAMLLYLDQALSIGPGSPFGAKIKERPNARKPGLNENLAREIMELHTLGVRTGYTQADVTEFARAMTGWTVAGIGRGPGAKQAGVDVGTPGSFAFAPILHEPGTRTIMGKKYSQEGEKQAQAVLDDLAVHKATATHIATKLARHFAGDNPPPALVGRLRTAFLHSNGDLPTLYKVLVDSSECWAPEPAKFKTPWEWSISTMRALGQKQVAALAVTGLMNQLGQPTWRPGQPVGYDDIAGSWAGSDAIMRRVEAAERMAGRAPRTIDARALAPKLFPDALTPTTGQALARAESPGQALALLFVAPEMMRR